MGDRRVLMGYLVLKRGVGVGVKGSGNWVLKRQPALEETLRDGERPMHALRQLRNALLSIV